MRMPEAAERGRRRPRESPHGARAGDAGSERRYSRSGGSQGVVFAIPVSQARQVIEQIIASGRGWLGVSALCSWAAALLLSMLLAACAATPINPPAPDLRQRIETAITPADHEALALSYDREAAATRDKAAEHRRMAKAYVGSRSGASMQAHCNAIVREYESVAMEYEGLARAHREVATQVKP